eukprot:symbB.v1.2.006932.t1/scaffold400.1/size211454/11
MRLSVNGSAPAIPASNEETPPEGYGLAVAVSMVGGGEQRLAQIRFEDDDTSPEKKKATPQRRPRPSRSLSASAARSSSKRRRGAAVASQHAAGVAKAPGSVPQMNGLEMEGRGGELIDLD